MAIDTAARRFSMMDFCQVFAAGLTPPDNAIVAADRATLVGLYEGIPLDSPVAVTSGTRRQRQIKSLTRSARRRRRRWLPEWERRRHEHL